MVFHTYGQLPTTLRIRVAMNLERLKVDESLATLRKAVSILVPIAS